MISIFLKKKQEFHATEHEQYRKQVNYDRMPNLNTSLSKPAEARVLFKNYFRIVSESGDKISAACRTCTDHRVIKGDLNALAPFIGHLKVCSCLFTLIHSILFDNWETFETNLLIQQVLHLFKHASYTSEVKNEKKLEKDKEVKIQALSRRVAKFCLRITFAYWRNAMGVFQLFVKYV